MLLELSENSALLESLPGTQAKRSELIQLARSHFESLHRLTGDEESKIGFARTLLASSQLNQSLSAYQAATDDIEEAIKFVEPIATTIPSKQLLFQCKLQLARLLVVHDNLAAAEELLDQTIASLEELDPNNSLSSPRLSATFQMAEIFQKHGRFEKVTALFQPIVAQIDLDDPIWDQRRNVALSCFTHLVAGYGDLMDDQSVISTSQPVIDWWQRRNENDRVDEKISLEMAVLFASYAKSQIRTGKHELAIDSFLESAGLFRKLVQDNPSVVDYRIGLGNSLADIGNAYVSANRHDFSMEFFHEGLDINRAIVKRYPKVDHYRASLADKLLSYSIALRTTSEKGMAGKTGIDESNKLLAESIELQKQLIKDSPENKEFQLDLAETWIQAANNTTEISDFATSVKRYDKAISLFQNLMKENPDTELYPLRLAATMRNQAIMHFQTGNPKKGHQQFESAVLITRELYESDPTKHLRLFEYAMSVKNLSVSFHMTNEKNMALKTISDLKTSFDKLERETWNAKAYEAYLDTVIQFRAMSNLGADADPQILKDAGRQVMNIFTEASEKFPGAHAITQYQQQVDKVTKELKVESGDISKTDTDKTVQ